jgi:hypothetical protein
LPITEALAEATPNNGHCDIDILITPTYCKSWSDILKIL